MRGQIAANKQELLALLRGGGAIPANLFAPIRSGSRRQALHPCRSLKSGFGSWSNWSRGTSVYNLCRAVRITGALNLQALAKSFDEILKRHEALRTQFIVVEGRPAQLVAPSAKDGDLFQRSQAARAASARARDGAPDSCASGTAFRSGSGRLLRVSLLRQSEEEHVLVVTTHHLVADAWSMGILARELWTFYQAFVTGQIARLPALPRSVPRLRGVAAGFSHRPCSTPTSRTGKNSLPIRRCSICRLIIEGRRARVFTAAGRRLLCRHR